MLLYSFLAGCGVSPKTISTEIINMKENTQPTPLNQESFTAIAGAFSRLASLSDKRIDAGPSDNTAAEKEQLIEFLATQFLAHAGEFIACYDLVHREYLPLANGLRRLALRCGILPAQQPTTKPENN